MNKELLGCLARLRRIQEEMKEKALCDAFDHRVRAAYFDAETLLSRGLGELDQIANTGAVKVTGRLRRYTP